MDFIEQELDAKRIVITILDLFTLHVSLCIGEYWDELIVFYLPYTQDDDLYVNLHFNYTEIIYSQN